MENKTEERRNEDGTLRNKPSTSTGKPTMQADDPSPGDRSSGARVASDKISSKESVDAKAKASGQVPDKDDTVAKK